VSQYRNILVAIDGSPDAAAALRHAVSLAHDQNAPLTLLTVVPPPPKPAGASGVPASQDLTELYVKILREAVESVPDDVGVTSRLEHGAIAETILRIAGEGEHDLLVMGSHGHSRMRRALLGSVSERLLHTATIPVLLMRAELKA
jgi:nucleotide-binding universal stress UspA family protein